MTKEKNFALFSATSQFFRAGEILCEEQHEIEWGVVTGDSAELYEVNYMTRGLKNKSESDMALW